MIEENLNSSLQIDENTEARLLLNKISNSINQVNSQEYGFNKRIKLPNSINNNYYTILINKNEVILEFNNKKGKTSINAINLVNSNNQTIESVQLFNGGTYLIKKTLINDNRSHIINQSSILFIPIEN